jgi:hypothetical protein
MILGRVKPELLPRIQSGSISFNMMGVFEHIIQRGLNANEHPFLQGRALWFASQYAECLNPEMKAQFIEGSIQALASSTVVHIFSLKAIRTFCDVLEESELFPFQGRLLESLARLASVASQETLYLALETLSFVVKVIVSNI